jgi:hypothetical protein
VEPGESPDVRPVQRDICIDDDRKTRSEGVTPEEFRQKMQRIYPVGTIYNPTSGGYDPEISHSNADDLMCQVLCELGYNEGVALFKYAEKWYN